MLNVKVYFASAKHISSKSQLKKLRYLYNKVTYAREYYFLIMCKYLSLEKLSNEKIQINL